MTESNFRCPEFECGLALPRDELRAHLEWDHNRPTHTAERLVEQADPLIDDADGDEPSTPADPDGS